MDIETATRDELIAYAKDVKGMDFPKNIKTENLRTKIGGGTVKVVKEDDDMRLVKIVIQAGDEDGGGEDVPIILNGRTYLIQRGEEADVPYAVVHILQNAKKTVYRTVKERDTGKSILQEREVLSYPFQVVA